MKLCDKLVSFQYEDNRKLRLLKCSYTSTSFCLSICPSGLFPNCDPCPECFHNWRRVLNEHITALDGVAALLEGNNLKGPHYLVFMSLRHGDHISSIFVDIMDNLQMRHHAQLPSTLTSTTLFTVEQMQYNGDRILLCKIYMVGFLPVISVWMALKILDQSCLNIHWDRSA